MSPFIFYSMTLRDAKLAVKGYRKRQRDEYIYNLHSVTNAIGSCFGGKKFKAEHPFHDMNNQSDVNSKGNKKYDNINTERDYIRTLFNKTN